jgi:hypothetical protein
MRTTRNKQTDTPAPCDPSATIHTQATPHTSNQSAPKKLVSILLTKCLLIELYLSSILSKQAASQGSPGEASRHQEYPALSLTLFGMV